ncbi:DsbA family protein [bacterium]|nr:DsbA family protein [bacterium]
MEIELWLDVSCPWCRGALPVMKRLLQEEAPTARLVWRPIRLHPLDPKGRALTELATEAVQFNRERGRPLGSPAWLHHPQLAHRLLALCRERADVEMWDLAESLWEANWVQAIDINAASELEAALVAPAEVWQQLARGEGEALVEADHRRALEIGLDGVPRFYVNGVIVPAWLEPEEVRQRLRAALA